MTNLLAQPLKNTSFYYHTQQKQEDEDAQHYKYHDVQREHVHLE